MVRITLANIDLAKLKSGAPWLFNLFLLPVGLVKIKGFELSAF